jgi:hypothetical protein
MLKILSLYTLNYRWTSICTFRKYILKEGDNKYLNTHDPGFKMQTMKSEQSMEIKKSKLKFHIVNFCFKTKQIRWSFVF